MNSRTTAAFRDMFAGLPPDVQHQARAAYHLFQQDPRHPGLRFKKVHATLPVSSARVGLHHRAVGVLSDNGIVWFWIGPHTEYDRLLSKL